MTNIAMLGTAMLAKALHPEVNLLWIKPTHVPAEDRSRSYSARTLCHSVLVPLSAEHGFSLGVNGREPLNNHPFIRMERLDDGTPVNAAGQAAFDYMMTLVREVQELPDTASALLALEAFISVRRRYVTTYAEAGEASISKPAELIEAIVSFMQLGSAGGAHAQAIAAGVIDATLKPDRVECGRINDPSRHYPGDVCIWKDGDRNEVAAAIEVRDKPVLASDIHIFARRCQTDGIDDCGVLMVSPLQAPLDLVALAEWADTAGLNLRIWGSWNAFVREALFWSDRSTKDAVADMSSHGRKRLIEAEVSAEALAKWDALMCKDASS